MSANSQGFDTYTQDGIDRPFGAGLTTAVLDEDNTYLAKFPTGFDDGDTIAADTFTIYAAEDWASGVSLSLALVDGDWLPSQVTDATLPATTGTPVVTGALGALSAGDAVEFDIAPLMQTVANNAQPWRGVAVTRLDSGAAVAMWAYAGDLPPVNDPTVADVLPQPTGLSPAGGRAVSASQVLLRVTNWASGLGEIALAAMQVQWSASTSFVSPLADDTLTVSSPEFDMALTSSGFALPALAATRYWRTRLQSTDGSWSDWSDPVATCWRLIGSLSITSPAPAPGNVSADPDPLLTYTYAGANAETQHRFTRASTLAPDVLLGDTGKTPSLTGGSGYVGYEVLDYGSYVDTVYVWDAADREDVPGAPSYATAEVIWSLTDDASIRPPDLDNVYQLGGTSPFVVVEWTQDHNADYKVFADNGSGEVNVSGTLPGASVLVSEDEAGRHYQWIWYGAQPGTLYDIRVRAFSDRRGSATSEVASILTDTVGLWLANPATGDYIHMLNPDLGKWERLSPGTAVYAPFEGSPYYRKIQGNRYGKSASFGGDLWPTDDQTVNAQSRAFNRMCESVENLTLVTPHEVVPVQITTDSDTPIDHHYLPRRVEFTAYQAALSTLAGSDATTPQTTTTVIDFESYADGDTVTTADPSGLIIAVTGTVQAKTAAAMHGSLRGCKLTDITGGSSFQIAANPLANTIDIYSSGITATPSTDRNMIRWRTASGQAAAIHIESTGKVDIRDGSGSRTVFSSAKILAAQQFRLQGLQVWNDGVIHVECRVWLGLNMEGVNPDIVLVSDVASAAAPSGGVNIGSITVAGYDWSIDDVRVSNTSASVFAPLGEPVGGTLGYVHASSMSSSRIIASAVQIGTATSVKLAYSTSLGSDGFPSSPSFGPTVAVNGYGCARLEATGLTAHTLYYFAVADGTSGVMFGTTGSCKTLYAANTSGSYTIGQWSCQTGGKFEAATAWQSIAAWGPDILVGQGDNNYAGGTYSPSTPVQKHLDKTYTGQYARIPAMNLALANASNEAQISDHEVAGNGQYESSPGVYGTWADQLAIIQANILAHQQARPVEYADTAPTPRGRYYFKDIFKNRSGGGTSVRLFMLDERTMDLSDGRDTDGAGKTKLGAPQLAWLAANLLTTGYNMLFFEGTVSWNAANNNIDKWSNYWTALTTVLAPLLVGKQVDAFCGDRHMLAFNDHTQNTVMPGVDVMVASAMEMFGLGVSAQETYKDSGGTTQTFGYQDNGILKRQYGRITLADDNAGTITRTWTGYDAITDAAVLGPFTRTFTY